MRVLIVEDEPIIALEIESIVLDRLPDAETVIVASVCRAMAEVGTGLELALLDIDVTDGKTYPLALELKLRHVPFTFVSGANSEEAPADLADAGFITKPFSRSEVERAVDELRAAGAKDPPDR